MSAAKRWFGICFAAWTAFAVLIAVWTNFEALYEGRPPHPRFIPVIFAEMYALGLMTPLLIWVAHAFPPTRRPLIAPLAMYVASLAACVAVGIPLFLLVNNVLFGTHATLRQAVGEGVFDFLTYAVVLTLIVAVAQVQVANERAARALRLEADLSRLRIEALQRQLHPHFIFNTLNAVSAIMQTDVAAAEEMIAALADLLRSATDKSTTPVMPLREELNLLDRYALIMKMRYGERLTVRISAEPRALEVPCPTFTLQPLVENAIVHGLEKTTSNVTVEIACRVEGDNLLIDVNDDGRIPNTGPLQEGVGISNTRARLAELYGHRAMLSIGPRMSQGMHLTLAIPTASAL